jgi:hypothetical protein
MSTRVWRNWVWAGVSALAISLNAADEPKAPAPPDVPPAKADAAPPNTESPAVAANPAPAAPAAPAADAAPPEAAKTFQPSFPPMLDQVVKLSETGADEAVIRAYVEKAASPYRVTGNDIVRLRERGVSQKVILALIEHSQFAEQASNSEIIAPPTPPTADASTAASSSEVALDYQDALAPYGSWYDLAGYGWCWQPTVVVASADWRPYQDDGYWRWSDYGWYWQSHYTWGWAPFHYGRWFCHASRGWMWCPDRVWGPAWVSWRNSSSRCGWAPLPPGACFNARDGWTHHGRRVGQDCDFGLRSSDFTFVDRGHFSDRHLGGHSLRGADAQHAYQNTVVHNNYASGPNNRIINQGVVRETVAASRQPFLGGPGRETPRQGSAIPFSNTRPATVPATSGSRAPVTVGPGTRTSAAITRPVSSAPVNHSTVARSAGSIGSVTPPRSAPVTGTVAPRSFTPRAPQVSAVRGPTVPATRTFRAPSASSVPRVTGVARTAPRAGVSTGTFSRSGGSVSAARSFAPRSFTPSAGNRAVMGRVSTGARSSVGHR